MQTQTDINLNQPEACIKWNIWVPVRHKQQTTWHLKIFCPLFFLQKTLNEIIILVRAHAISGLVGERWMVDLKEE